jgi:predicted alpha/beta superfamily hydrolase
VVQASGVADSESVFISGNDELLGGWDPGFVKLVKRNDSTWSQTLWFQKGKNLEFKFTKGLWDYEALNNDGSIPVNNFLKVTSDTSLYFRVIKWKNKEPRINYGQITGVVKYHYNFEGEGLKHRDIIVWLPPSYELNLKKRYPVLYMHDGQNVFDPTTSSFGYDWRADEVADSLINAEKINEIIIVGIYNTTDRGFEYSYSPLGYKYMDFVVSKLKPFVDSEYRTLSDAENTAVAGSSLGALITFMLSWNYPDVFSKAACFSSALKIKSLNYVDTVINYSGAKKDIKLYFDNGGIGLDADLQPGTDEMIIELQNKGFELGKDIIWYVDKNAFHSEKAWAERIWRPLVFFFNKK